MEYLVKEVKQYLDNFRLNNKGKCPGRYNLMKIFPNYSQYQLRMMLKEYHQLMSGYAPTDNKSKNKAFQVLKQSAKQLIKKSINKPMNIIQLSDSTGLSINLLKKLAIQVSDDTGIPITIDQKSISVNRMQYKTPQSFTPISSLGKSTVKIGIVSDTHFGSIWQQLTVLHMIYDQFKRQKINFAVHAGDLTDGHPNMHKGHSNNMFIHTYDQTVQYVADVYPRASFVTYAIDGNHDFSWMKNFSGLPTRKLSMLRKDIIYVSQKDSSFRDEETGLKVDVIHPSGGMPYAKSYRGQKIWQATVTEVLQKYQHRSEIDMPHVVAIGHLHTPNYFPQAGIHVLQLPCLQSKTDFFQQKTLTPFVGGVIITFELDNDGNIFRIIPEILDMNRYIEHNDY